MDHARLIPLWRELHSNVAEQPAWESKDERTTRGCDFEFCPAGQDVS